MPERVFYSNACWTRSTVAHAASNAIGLIAFDSARDLNRIAVGYPNAELMLNLCVNADAEDANAALGCSLDEAPELLQLVCDMGLNCVGVSFTVGAGINYAEAASMYSRAIKDVACLFDFACTRLGMQLNVLNIGGGFSLMGSSAGFQQVCLMLHNEYANFRATISFYTLKFFYTNFAFFQMLRVTFVSQKNFNSFFFCK